MPATAKTANQQRGRPFKKGRSGNPNGRSNGSRNKVSLAIDELLDDEAEKLTRKAIELALNGDTVALRLCLERLCPPRKERLPKLEDTSDLIAGISAIMAAVANGELTPGEGQALASLIEAQRRTLETEDIEQRLRALEAGRDR
jgi:hypothetical protein